jgi:hypothetical protein
VEGIVQQGADALASDRGRVRVAALCGEVGGAIQVFLAQADLAPSAAAKSNRSCTASSASSACDPGYGTKGCLADR